MFRDVIIQPLLAGLSTGLFCSAYCLPVVAPFLVAEQRGPRETARALAEFILGRLLGYLLFGAAVGLLGEMLDERIFGLVSAAALVVLSAVLVLYAVGLVRPRWPACLGSARARRLAPLGMGLLMGLNVCPPFLVSVTYVFTLHSALKGMLYFLVFFAATTVYFLPLFFAGWLSRMAEFRWVARLSAVLVGVLFGAYGILVIARGMGLAHASWAGP